MLKSFHAKLRKDEGGFTLIELMVVVLIIAILIAIAIPVFLGIRSRAQDSDAQSDVRNAETAAQVLYTDASGDYSTVTGVAALEAVEPSLSTANTLAVTTENTGGADTIAISALSDSGKSYCALGTDGDWAAIVAGTAGGGGAAVASC